MVAERDSCDLFSECLPAEYIARRRILDEFSPSALLPEPNPRKRPNEEEVPTDMSAPTRVNLRKLAMAANLIERTPESFDLKPEELIEILEEKYPDISDMDNEAVRDLILQAEQDGGDGDDADEAPAKKAPARRGRGKKVEEEAPAKKAPARRGRDRPAAPHRPDRHRRR